MSLPQNPSKRRAFAGLFFAAAALGGCSSVGGMFGSSSNASTGDSTAQASVQNDDFECPGVEVRAGASTLVVTTAGTASERPEGAELRYQGSIVRSVRECRVAAGQVNLKVGIEGRIVLGPAGGPGQLDVPIRVAVVHDGPSPKTVTTKLYRAAVVIPPDQGNSAFTYVAEDLSFPMPARAGDIDKYVIYLGFDPQSAAPQRPAPRKPAKRARAQG